MKRFKLFFACLLMTVLSIGQVWGAADVTYDFTGSGWSVSNGTLTNGTVSFTGASAGSKGSFKMNSGYFMLGKENAYINFPTYSKAVEKIVVTGRSGASASTKQNIYVGTTAVSEETTSSATTQTYNIDANYRTAGTTYTFKVTSDHNAQITKIEIYYVGDVNKPTVSVGPSDSYFVNSAQITLTPSEGATAYYTLDGSIPSSSSTQYTAPFSVNETTTVKAIAIKNNVSSDVAEKTFTKLVPKTTMDEIFAAASENNGAEKTIAITFDNWVVSGVKNNNVYVTNGTKGFIIYYANHGFAANDILSGTAIVKIKLYCGAAEITEKVSGTINIAKNGSVTPIELDAEGIAALTSVNTGSVIKISGTCSSSNNKYYINGVQLYNALCNFSVTADTEYDCTGVYIYYKKDANTDAVNEIAPRSADDIEVKQAATLPEVTGLVELTAAEVDHSYIVDLTNAIVTYVSGKNAFIEDANAGALIFLQDHGFAAGDCLNGKYQVTTTSYQGKFEITAIEATTGTKSTVEEIPLTTLTIAQLNADFDAYESRRVKIENVTVTDAVETGDATARTGEISDGENTLTLYGNNNVTADKNDELSSIVGYPGFFNTNQQLTVWAQADITVLEKVTIRFWNSLNWGSVKAHVWNGNGNVTEWPGDDTQFANGWNYYELDKGNSILFHNNEGTQTVDISEVTENACYILTGESDGDGHKEVELDNDCDDRFYIAGNEALTGKDWNTTADRLENGSITFYNVAASDELKFKITNGVWAWNRGAGAFDSDCSNVENTGGDDVIFSTTEAKDITITYDKVNDKICVQAVTHVEPDQVAIVVAYGDKYYAMTTTSTDSKGFDPVEVTVDNEGNVVVNSDEEKNSILWIRNIVDNTATFQNASDKYLAHKGTGTELQLQNNEEAWTWDADNECYYVAVTKNTTTTKRSFFYQESGNIFRNYSIEENGNLGKSGYSGAPTFYAANKVIVSTTAKLKFFAPVAWESVKAFTWEGTNTGDHLMTAVEEGSRWFECELEKGVPFLVYNGTWGGLNQTANIDALTADKCFAWTASTNEEGKIVATEISDCAMNYYFTGDLANSWEPDAVALTNGAKTFNEVAAGTYKFKITNGTWAWNLGAAYVDQAACSNVTIEETDADGNVIFSVVEESNITITYNPATEKISIVADIPTPVVYYTKVTSTEDITAGTYLIVYEGINVAFDGGLATLDATGNTIDVDINDHKIAESDEVNAASFFLDPEIGTVKSASGNYIGVAGNSNGLKQSEKIYTYKHTFSIDNEGNAIIAAVFEGSDMTLRYNATSNQARFRYFKNNGQQSIQLYKKAEVAKASPELAFAETAVEVIKGEAFTAPALSNAHNVAVAYEASSNKASVVAETGEVTINNAGVVTIYAISTANDEYRESYAAYTITIKAFETVRENLEVDRHYTVCLPKNIINIDGATFWNLSKRNEAGSIAYLEEVTAPEAGKPYIIQATATELKVVYGNESVDAPVENGALRGTFDYMDADALSTAGSNIYMLFNNELRPIGTNNYLAANRAYVLYNELVVDTPVSAPDHR